MNQDPVAAQEPCPDCGHPQGYHKVDCTERGGDNVGCNYGACSCPRHDFPGANQTVYAC